MERTRTHQRASIPSPGPGSCCRACARRAGTRRAARACTPAAPRGSARDSTPSGSGADTASSAPIGAPALTAAPRLPDAPRAPSSAGPRSSDTRLGPCTKTAGDGRARSPRTETAPHQPRRRRRAGTPGTRAPRTAAAPRRRRPPPPHPGTVQMLGDYLMQHGVLGVSRPIRGRCIPSLWVAPPRCPANAQRWIRRLRPASGPLRRLWPAPEPACWPCLRAPRGHQGPGSTCWTFAATRGPVARPQRPSRQHAALSCQWLPRCAAPAAIEIGGPAEGRTQTLRAVVAGPGTGSRVRSAGNGSGRGAEHGWAALGHLRAHAQGEQ